MNVPMKLVELGVCKKDPKSERNTWDFYQVPVPVVTADHDLLAVARQRYLDIHAGTLVYHAWLQCSL